MIDKLHAIVRGWAYRSTRRYKHGPPTPRFDTSDVVQEVTFKIWEQAQRNEDLDINEGFVNCVTRRVLANKFRFHSAKKRDASQEASSNFQIVDLQADDPHWQAENAENFRLMTTCLCMLPHDKRRALEMKYFNNAKQTDIAVELGLTIDKVRTLLAEAKKDIRRIAASSHGISFNDAT